MITSHSLISGIHRRVCSKSAQVLTVSSPSPC